MNSRAIAFFGSSFFSVMRNNFFDNDLRGFGQVYDGGRNNTFKYNFYSDWTVPDRDHDGIVDVPYPLNEENSSVNSFPNATWYPIQEHILTTPKILEPHVGEIYKTIAPIKWLTSIDTEGHDISYHVHVLKDGGLSWRVLGSQLQNTSLLWDTRDISYGNYVIKVVARDDEGFQVIARMFGSFFIRNLDVTMGGSNASESPSPAHPSFLSPNLDILSIRIPSFGIQIAFIAIILALAVKRGRLKVKKLE